MLRKSEVDSTHLNQCITYAHQALMLRPPGHPYRVEILSRLGAAYIMCDAHEDGISDLNLGVEFCQEAVDLLPPTGSTVLVRRDIVFNNLGLGLTMRYQRLGRLVDLERALSIHRVALEMRGPGSPMRWSSLLNLARALLDKYDHTQQDEDVKEATDLLYEGLDICPLGKRGHSQMLCVLAMAYRNYHRYTGEYKNVDWMIAILQQSLDFDGPQTPHYAGDLALLIEALIIRHDLHYDPSALDRAVVAGRELLVLDKNLHPQGLGMVASAYSARFKCTDDTDDAQEALRLLLKAFSKYTEDHPYRACCQAELAQQYMLPKAPHFDLANALEHIFGCLSNVNHPVETNLLHALDFLKSLDNVVEHLKPENMSLLLTVYHKSIDLLHQVAHFGLNHSSRLAILKRADGLPGAAALHFINQAELARALEMLEAGRAVFWQQYLRLRAPADSLPADLAARFRGVLLELEENVDRAESTADARITGVTVLLPAAQKEARAARRRAAGVRLAELLSEIRGRPGLEGFLVNEPFEVLRLAAAKGPVVILVPGKAESYALIINDAGADMQKIILRKASENTLVDWRRTSLQEVLMRKRTTMDRGMRRAIKGGAHPEQVLSDFWAAIMAPIINHLGFQRRTGRERKRVFFCVIGAFNQLPLHAAGIVDRHVADYLVATYIPTVGALLKARKEYTPVRMSELKMLIALAATPATRRPLPSAKHEVNIVGELFNANSLLGISNANAAPHQGLSSRVPRTSTEVLTYLPEAMIVHLACHAYQDPGTPLNSGFVMEDKILTMSQLIELRLDRAMLAFLSACETAKGDEAQPNQSIDLASAMLFAGFKSVVGTMWLMADIDGPLVASMIYEQLLTKHSDILDLDIIPYALDDATRELRQRCLHSNRWAPYIHVGI